MFETGVRKWNQFLRLRYLFAWKNAAEASLSLLDPTPVPVTHRLPPSRPWQCEGLRLLA